jgi:hypothetical protein
MKDIDSGRGDEIAELARLLPVLEERDLPASREHPLKEHLLIEFRMAGPGIPEAGHGSRAPQHSRRPRRATVAAAVSGVLAAATAVAAVTLSTAARHPAGPSAVGQAQHTAAARLLARIAVAASRQPTPAVRGHQWEYIKTVEKAIAGPFEWTARGTKTPAGRKLTTYHSQLWRPVSDICLGFVGRTTPPQWGASRPASGSSHSGTGGTDEKCPSAGSLNRSTYRLLQSLPTSPHRLLNLIYTEEQGHGPSPDQEAFTTIGDLLRDSIVPPQVSAALYRAAALIPGVSVVPDAVNAIGQHGVAVTLTVPSGQRTRDVREEWIFDKTTLQNIGESTISNGSVTDVTAIVDRAFVDHPGQTPPAGS